MKIIKKLIPFFIPEYTARRYIKKFIYYSKKNSFFRFYFSRKLLMKYNISLGKYCEIDDTVEFPHPQNIIIGDYVKIGKHCVVYHNTTIGIKSYKPANIKYPIIEDNTIIYSGAILIGDIKIGSNSIIGANSVINKSVLQNSIVAGIPGKVIKIR